MKKTVLISALSTQAKLTKKSTRQDIVKVVSALVDKHFTEKDEIEGLSPTRNGTGFNLGDVVEIVAHKVFRNKTEKSASNKGYDLLIKGEKVEFKFATSDAYAHPINNAQKVDYYLIATYTKKEGGNIFKVPASRKADIDTNNQGRITTNQKVRYLDRELTREFFGAVGC